MVRNQGRVTRFVVMAVLQAARAEALGLARDSAYSWGLNRAIFYAAAKQGFRDAGTKTGEPQAPAATRPPELFRLGDDEAYRDLAANGTIFAIGGESQTPERFDHQVVSRFGTPQNFQLAWSEATRIVGQFDRSTLESRRRFYEEVYKPRRDELSDSWTQRFSPPPKARSRQSR